MSTPIIQTARVDSRRVVEGMPGGSCMHATCNGVDNHAPAALLLDDLPRSCMAGCKTRHLTGATFRTFLKSLRWRHEH